MRIPASWARRGLIVVSVLGALNLLVIPIAWSRPVGPLVVAQVDSDPVISVTVTPASVVEDGVGTATFTFTRVGPTGPALTVDFGVSGTATSGIDYEGSLGSSVPLASGQTVATITLDPKPDSEDEDDENVVITLVDGDDYNLGTAKTASVTIQDDDLPTVRVAGTQDAAEAGLVQGKFTIKRATVTSSPVTVSYTVGGDATSGVDYEPLGSAVIPGGQDFVDVKVIPKADTSPESTELVTLTIVAQTSSYIVGAPGSGEVKIFDDDAVLVTVVATDASAGEGTTPDTGKFTLSRTGPVGAILNVSYTLSGSAEPADYTPLLSGTATFAAGSDTATITITPVDDSLDEPTQTLVLTVINGTGYVAGSPSSATINIADNDDVVVTVLASDASAGEGTTPNTGEFTITRTGPTGPALTVFFTLGGTSSAGDYSASHTSSVTIPSGASSATVTITPVNDATPEPTETVILSILDTTTYDVGIPGSALVQILDDDGYIPEKREDPKDVCKNGGWKDFGVFKNQGDCVSYIATGGKNPPALGPAPTAIKSLVPTADDNGHRANGKAKGKAKGKNK